MSYKGPNKSAHIADGTVIVVLERRDGTVLPCFIDAADWPKVRGYRWSVQDNKHTLYAGTMMEGRKMFLHRLLLPEAEQVDHRDLNGLNNRRNNLRPATHTENQRNRSKRVDGITSQFKGVCIHKKSNKFQVHIRVNTKRLFLGYFTNEEDAAHAYDVAALKYHGEFAKLNFPLQKAA